MAKQKSTLNQADVNLLEKTFATKKDLDQLATKEIVIDAAHSILNGVQTMFDSHNKENKRDFGRLETKIDNVERHLKDDINGLKAEFSATVTKSEFNK